MKLYGSLTRLTSLSFRQNSQDVTVTPNTGTTYTGTRTLQLPPGDASATLVSDSGTQTLTNKSISGTANTITGISLTGAVTGVLPIANGGTNSLVALSNNRVMQSSGGSIVEAAAITAARALVSDSNGIPTATAVTTTEIGYVSGVTSSIQTQIAAKVAKSGDTMTGDLTLSNQHRILLQDSSTNVIGLKAPASVTSYDLVLPADDGSNLQFLQTNGSGVTTWASVGINSFEADWVTVDGTTKVVTHSLGTLFVIVEVYDKTDGTTILVDSIARTDVNTVTLVSSEAPPAAGFKVLIHSA